MTQFEDRERAFEARFAHDEELRFKSIARRNKLLGVWAAQQLGREGADAEAYAKDVIRADFDEPGDEDVFRKVYGDLSAAGISITEEAVRLKMRELLMTAAEEISAS
ncbi:DUF1476 domain-containing protein [Acuticoccus kandeliae]|uniref:DUF1476 domain-containing protein n=1 Tax=Acuticoccus kandeliae TaxID=2073160 RepID=UPI000D3E971B|nr:DUF1476 domain-containing protein [Acuticoccus kandeliae]